MEKIVLDTNCLVQSISPRSPYRRIWDSFFDGTNLFFNSQMTLISF